MKRGRVHHKHLVAILGVLSVMAVALAIGIAVVTLNNNGQNVDCLSYDDVGDIVDCISVVSNDEEEVEDALYEEGMQRALEQGNYETYAGLMAEISSNKTAREDCEQALKYYRDVEDVSGWSADARIEFYSGGIDAALECENEDIVLEYQTRLDEVINNEEYMVYYE